MTIPPANRLTGPLVLLAVFAFPVALWAAALLVAFPSFIYYVNGFAQFGMRHALDFEPFLVALIVFTLRNEGSLLLNGPVLDDGDLAGIGIFAGQDRDAVRALAEADPSVEATLRKLSPLKPSLIRVEVSTRPSGPTRATMRLMAAALEPERRARGAGARSDRRSSTGVRGEPRPLERGEAFPDLRSTTSASGRRTSC